jgi:hypothetical protein
VRENAGDSTARVIAGAYLGSPIPEKVSVLATHLITVLHLNSDRALFTVFQYLYHLFIV